MIDDSSNSKIYTNIHRPKKDRLGNQKWGLASFTILGVERTGSHTSSDKKKPESYYIDDSVE